MADRLLKHGSLVSPELLGKLANPLAEPWRRAHRLHFGGGPPSKGADPEVAGEARRVRSILRELLEGSRKRVFADDHGTAHSTCSVGRTTISLMATRRGLVTMYCTGSATSAGSRRSISAPGRPPVCHPCPR